MGRYFVQNFGCRATQADGAALESQLAAKGLEAADDRTAADLVVLNTCTVTQAADDDVRQTIRRVHRENPLARILVTGCYAQRAPQELAAMPGVEWVVGNSHKTQIANLVTLAPSSEGTPYHGNIHVGDIFAQQDFLSAPVEDASGDRTRPNLKIQDGCNNRCSFCIIPFVRGRSRSLPADQVVAQVRGLAARYREVVLSGINLGRWGREPGSTMRLAGLVRRLLAETDVERLRLSSVEPMDFSDDLLGLMTESPRIAKHVHAPLQSGCDTVLRRMHRKYRPRHYADRVTKARAWMPDAAIGADVMVGFPGETEAEFEDSRAFIDSLPFTYLHVFTYSERPGTPAERELSEDRAGFAAGGQSDGGFADWWGDGRGTAGRRSLTEAQRAQRKHARNFPAKAQRRKEELRNIRLGSGGVHLSTLRRIRFLVSARPFGHRLGLRR